MNNETRRILEGVREGSVSVDEALLRLKTAPFEDIGFAKVDLHRGIRQGIPEVIYSENKTPSQLEGIVGVMAENGQKRILLTRLKKETYLSLSPELSVDYRENARLGLIGGFPEPDGMGSIVVVTGGTSDLPVAEEAALTAEALGNRVVRVYDAGVSGLHRLLSKMDVLMSATVVIAIAGMEGALASVVGGLCDCPVIAVPTSVGYGAAFGGMTALLSMLNSCSAGVSVVNIDNGFGAGYLASMINHIGGTNESSLS